ncbi:Protein KTI12 [Orchesella cincta]|uniref:Protein KTI12 homolog n=1 Tax=Orchesella cincta TaxID=48709 RepID=A0A1D2N8S0_ORCCI|nr:Protein KTI12 [Orchesella cincta]
MFEVKVLLFVFQSTVYFKMPLVVMCGYPSSGKSTWTKKLAEYLEKEQGKQVHVVKEEEQFRGEKNDILDDSRKEKELRAKVKSESQRLLTKDNVVIMDALNYIKGYRYELFCISKAVPTRQVTVHCDVSEAQAWEWNINTDRPDNEKYTREVFEHLVQRFETPDPQNRWDSPFFSVLSGEELDLQGINTSLFFNKTPKKNMSTQSNPVTESNYLGTMEKVTSEIIQKIIAAGTERDSGTVDDIQEVEVPYSKLTVHVEDSLTVSQLNKLKRQFITMCKTSSLKGEPGDMFVQYLNSQLSSA